MKRTLGHLPRRRASLLRNVGDVVRDVAGDRFAMLILFGSYARGDWVDDEYFEGQTRYTYRSDFDLLLIVNQRKDAHGDRAVTLTGRIEKERRREGLATRRHPTAHVIIHDVEDVNKQLGRGRYFFTDIKRQGVLLATSGKHKLARRRKLNPKERQGMARAEFKQWFTSAKHFYDDFKSNVQKRRYKKAAFELHQATERFYAAVLLVFTNYKPKTHDLRTLRRRAASQHPEFIKVFPLATKEQRRLFELLRAAYVEARYNPAYKITRAELEYLGKRVRVLQRLTKRLCQEKIESFV